MSADLKTLYPEVIRTHNAEPFRFEKRPEARVTLKAYNPVCGDRFEVFVNSGEDRIDDLHFYGFGCAISKASASVMVKTLLGKSLTEAQASCNTFLDFIDQKSGSGSLALPDEFMAFSGVHEFPERYDCATLAWKEMKKFLESKKNKP